MTGIGIRVPPELSAHDPEVLAPAAGLEVVTDEAPGIRRRRCGRGFAYVAIDGSVVRPPDRDRLSALAVPPAWTDVWLCPRPQGYLQATGRDDAGRKQYRYHETYRDYRDAQKFARLAWFPRALDRIRRGIDDWITEPVGSRHHAIAAALRLVDVGLVRPGNEQSAQAGHRGATTLHVDDLAWSTDGDDRVSIEYQGKSGVARTVVVEDDVLVAVLADLADASEERLFWYEGDDGEPRRISGADLNGAIVELAGPAFRTKDFRTWGGSRTALEARVDGADEIEAVDAAAEALGNTRAVARASYVHPLVLDADAATIAEVWRRSRRSSRAQRGDRALAKLLRPVG